ncbi:hypothetical protein ACCAA_260002 [Candidatus Accumulibacter aalborgensis]|uniref:Uncharacterized protein n=1 Tax=Candidatus Accumulibacter aalborgensis TaxID=1860102 RepID=A0A1A8XLR3_9PROT|nr:hypothetical protein ACCAA_260002 [Candidatus Accumulibacter aalborgensis]
MKLPRDLSGPVLIRQLAKLGYAVTRQQPPSTDNAGTWRTSHHDPHSRPVAHRHTGDHTCGDGGSPRRQS